ncbi:Uncharacterised protein [Mycobacterium tuberculosis]|nr:Uncharacterised protein [Mycobacterium tuberculosis]CFS41382.1 Uncharacterised protein [Mycobacterium tuberculosis]CKV96724.1 Uncharacterised protein [Mycobacterium tuberculosis]CLA87133.1 Uncharacterised protein [Mycobacterium tuberculosis]CNX12420.1 Uncharacterised protein [Mycobacterium tuberculosis]
MRVAGAGAAVGQDAGVGDEVVRRRFGDLRGDDVAGTHARLAGGEVHQAPVARPPAHARRDGVLAPFPGGHQHLDGLPDQGAVGFQRDLLLQRDQAFIAFLHNGFRQLSVELRGRCPGPLGVLEGKCGREAGPAHHVERGREVLFGLPGETDDQIGGNRGMRDGRPHALDDAEVALGTIGPPHRAQDPVGSGL